MARITNGTTQLSALPSAIGAGGCRLRASCDSRPHAEHTRRATGVADGRTRGPATPSTARALCGSAARGGGLDVESVYVSDSAYRSKNVCIPCQLNDIGGLSGRNSFTTEFTRAPARRGTAPRPRGAAFRPSASQNCASSNDESTVQQPHPFLDGRGDCCSMPRSDLARHLRALLRERMMVGT